MARIFQFLNPGVLLPTAADYRWEVMEGGKNKKSRYTQALSIELFQRA
jgi:hypothetical protein